MANDEDDVGGRPLRGVVEVEWDGWEEERSRSKAPWVIGGLLLVAVLAVGGLTWWAVGSEAELHPDLAEAPDDTVPDEPAPSGAPTLDELRGSIPEDLDGCVPPPDRPDGAAPDGTVRLECPRPSPPELVTFTLFPDVAARDEAFADSITLLELDAGAPGDCALGGGVVHGYRGDRGGGRVACRRVEDRVDIAWTDGTTPVLGVAGGFGPYPEQYAWWSGLVGRTDGEFPLAAEQALLDQLPDELTTRCQRDLGLTEAAGGVVAVTCQPAVGEATQVSWVRFADADAMTGWIDAERARLASTTVGDTTDDACRPSGRGPSGALPPPWFGAAPYRQGTSTGTLLCHVDAEGRSVLTWTRAGSLIGSVAVSDGSIGDVTMADLAAWWEAGGHLP